MTSGLAVFLAFFLPGLIIVSANAVIFFFIAREVRLSLPVSTPIRFTTHLPQLQNPTKARSERNSECTSRFSFQSVYRGSSGSSWCCSMMELSSKSSSWLSSRWQLHFRFLKPLTTQGYLIYASYCLNAKVFARWAGFLGKFIPYFRRFEHMGSSTTSGTSGTSGTSSSGSSRM